MSEEPSKAGPSVAQDRLRAEALGEQLSELIEDPEAFVATLHEGLAALHEPVHAGTLEPAARGSRTRMVVAGPWLEAVTGPLGRALDGSSPASALWLAQRLSREDAPEVRLFALPCAERSLAADPERTWQLLRQLGRGAGERVEVDRLAEPWARGLLGEPFRWAELEQLVYSDHVAERRLVGATIARIPEQVPAQRRHELAPEPSGRAFALVGQLIGDDAPLVQEALSWAIREWSPIDPRGAAAFLRDQAAVAIERRDGHRARVLRDSLPSQPTGPTEELPRRLAGIRHDPRAPSTSAAAEVAATFAAALPRADDAIGQQGRRYTRSRA